MGRLRGLVVLVAVVLGSVIVPIAGPPAAGALPAGDVVNCHDAGSGGYLTRSRPLTSPTMTFTGWVNHGLCSGAGGPLLGGVVGPADVSFNLVTQSAIAPRYDDNGCAVLAGNGGQLSVRGFTTSSVSTTVVSNTFTVRGVLVSGSFPDTAYAFEAHWVLFAPICPLAAGPYPWISASFHAEQIPPPAGAGGSGCNDSGYVPVWAGEAGTPLRLSFKPRDAPGVDQGGVVCYGVWAPTGPKLVGGEAYVGGYAGYQWIVSAGVNGGNYADPDGAAGQGLYASVGALGDVWIDDGSKPDLLRVALYVPYLVCGRSCGSEPIAGGMVWGTGVAVGWVTPIPAGPGGTGAAYQFSELCLFAAGTQLVGCGVPTAAGVTTTGASPVNLGGPGPCAVALCAPVGDAVGTSGNQIATVYLGTTSVPIFGVHHCAFQISPDRPCSW